MENQSQTSLTVLKYHFVDMKTIDAHQLYWAHVFVTPCLAISAVSRTAEGELSAIRFGHFTAHLGNDEIPKLLNGLDPRLPLDVLMCGWAGRARESVEKDVERLSADLNRFQPGRFNARWIPSEAAGQEIPLLTDTLSGLPISDLGFNLAGEISRDHSPMAVNRYAIFGICPTPGISTDHALISIMTIRDKESGQNHKEARLIAPGLGVVSRNG